MLRKQVEVFRGFWRPVRARCLERGAGSLAEAYEQIKADLEFQEELNYYFKHYVGRPSPLYHARRLSETLGGAQIYLKRKI